MFYKLFVHSTLIFLRTCKFLDNEVLRAIVPKSLFSTQDNLQVLPCEYESQSLSNTLESPIDVKEREQILWVEREL